MGYRSDRNHNPLNSLILNITKFRTYPFMKYNLLIATLLLLSTSSHAEAPLTAKQALTQTTIAKAQLAKEYDAAVKLKVNELRNKIDKSIDIESKKGNCRLLITRTDTQTESLQFDALKKLKKEYEDRGFIYYINEADHIDVFRGAISWCKKAWHR